MAFTEGTSAGGGWPAGFQMREHGGPGHRRGGGSQDAVRDGGGRGPAGIGRSWSFESGQESCSGLWEDAAGPGTTSAGLVVAGGEPRVRPDPPWRPAGACCSLTGGCGPGHRPWALTRGLRASLSEDPLLSTTPEQLDIPPAADEGPAYPPLRAARPHRLLSVQTLSHSVRPTLVSTCVSLTTGGLTVSCRRCSYLRSLGMSACTFSCGDSLALPSEGCWPLRALEGVPIFHSW